MRISSLQIIKKSRTDLVLSCPYKPDLCNRLKTKEYEIIVIGSRAYNELVGRIEKIEAAIASLPEKGRAWNKEYINDEWMDGEQVCRYLGISGRTLQRLRSDHVITYSAINRKLYYSLTEIRRVLKERSVRRKNRPKE